MVKRNVADSEYQTETENLLGFNNVTMTKKEAFDLSTWINNMVDLGDFAEDGIKESALVLAELIETTANLGQAYSEDQDNMLVDLIIAADYVTADAENEQENVDETTKDETEVPKPEGSDAAS